jgi:outer membrane protein assembly factor BamB
MKQGVWSVVFLLLACTAWAADEPNSSGAKPFDWPQWQGPERSSISRETGLLKSWPEGGPPLAWKAEGLGEGFSGPAVSAGRIFLMGNREEAEYVIALAEEGGKELWSREIGPVRSNGGGYPGPRGTPTVTGDLLYAVGINGDLVCLETASGKEVWRKNYAKDFKGRMMTMWGYSESPLVDGEKLICTPGGKEATMVALNKKTGEVIWKAQVPEGDGSGYSSVIAADFEGQRQYVQLLGRGVVGIAASDGTFLWRYNKVANGVANITTSIYQDGFVFASTAYTAGGALLKLAKEDSGVKAEEVYFTKKMRNHHGGIILLDGFLYGANGGNEGGRLTCLEFKTGKVMWEAERNKAPKGSVALADGRLYYRTEDRGIVMLINPTPDKYVEVSRFQQPDRSDKKAWPHPVIANGKLYIRDQGVLFCYNVKQQ